MSDHDKLREAIKIVQGYNSSTRRTVAEMERMHFNEALALVAAAAESTLPKTKMAEVWRVEYCARTEDGWSARIQNFTYQWAADNRAMNLHTNDGHACIRITGPWQQEVPHE